jgi:hypothetical protein
VRFSEGGGFDRAAKKAARKAGKQARKEARQERRKQKGGQGIFAALSPWHKKNLSPAVQIKVRKGHRVTVKNVGTDNHPAWLIQPKGAKVKQAEVDAATKKQQTEDDATGAIFTTTALALAAPIATLTAKAIEKRRKLKTTPFRSTLEPGEEVVFDGVGAVLIDSDGKRAYV